MHVARTRYTDPEWAQRISEIHNSGTHKASKKERLHLIYLVPVMRYLTLNLFYTGFCRYLSCNSIGKAITICTGALPTLQSSFDFKLALKNGSSEDSSFVLGQTITIIISYRYSPETITGEASLVLSFNTSKTIFQKQSKKQNGSLI